MKALLQVPFYKLINYRAFWVLFLSLLILTFLVTLVLFKVAHTDLVDSNIPMQGFFSYPYVWQNLTWLNKIGNYFFCLLIILLICNDFENRVIRQHVIDGFEKGQVLASYLALCGAFALFSVLLTLILGLVFGESVDKQSFMIPDNIKMFGTSFLQSFALFEFSMLLALLLTRAIPVVVVLFLWHIIIEPVAGWLLDQHVWRGISEILPFHVIGELIPEPYVLGAVAVKTSVHINIVLLSLGYIALFGLVSWLRLRFSDL